MAINVATGFNVQTNLPIDKRFQFETLQEMKNLQASLLYEGVLSYNKETEKYYTYSEDNTEESLLGKWREFSAGSDIIYFNSKAEWEGAKAAGELDANKYYAYPNESSSGSGETTPGTPIIYFSGKAAYEAAKAAGQLDEGTYYSYIGGLMKGSLPIVQIDSELSSTSENTIQNKVVDKAIKDNSITYFATYNEWKAAKDAGTLDANKYYSYPTEDTTVIPAIELPKINLKVEYQDGTTKTYVVYGQEV